MSLTTILLIVLHGIAWMRDPVCTKSTTKIMPWTPHAFIYINDLPSTTQVKVPMHDGDIRLCHTVRLVIFPSYNQQVNEYLHLLGNWLKRNKLLLNAAKTKSMLICTKSRRKILNNNGDEFNLLHRDRELKFVDLIKYLGVHIDYSLSWKDHLKCVTSKVPRGTGMPK